MAYVCELGTGQRVYLDNQGTQTVVTTSSSSAGQQQQASSSFITGSWTSPPELFQAPNGVVLKIKTAQGEFYIQVEGGSMSVRSGMPPIGSFPQMQVQQVASPPASSMPPMQPMEPMKPMKMGDMEMRMGESISFSPPAQSTKHFCPQCGTSVSLSDRFCASCGNRLQ